MLVSLDARDSLRTPVFDFIRLGVTSELESLVKVSQQGFFVAGLPEGLEKPKEHQLQQYHNIFRSSAGSRNYVETNTRGLRLVLVRENPL